MEGIDILIQLRKGDKGGNGDTGNEKKGTG